MFAFTNPVGNFRRSKAAIENWAQSVVGKSYKSWIISTLRSARSLEMVVHCVFALMSVSSFQGVEDNIEKPCEPLVDFARFIQRMAVHGELCMLRVLAYTIRDYIRAMEALVGEGYFLPLRLWDLLCHTL
jgi:hypothetical protein